MLFLNQPAPPKHQTAVERLWEGNMLEPLTLDTYWNDPVIRGKALVWDQIHRKV